MKKYGRVPKHGWLRAHGLGRLYQAIANCPDAFAHLPQARRQQSLAKHVKAAEAREKARPRARGGGWLVKHGFTNLYAACGRHPEAFAHI